MSVILNSVIQVNKSMYLNSLRIFRRETILSRSFFKNPFNSLILTDFFSFIAMKFRLFSADMTKTLLQQINNQYCKMWRNMVPLARSGH